MKEPVFLCLIQEFFITLPVTVGKVEISRLLQKSTLAEQSISASLSLPLKVGDHNFCLDNE